MISQKVVRKKNVQSCRVAVSMGDHYFVNNILRKGDRANIQCVEGRGIRESLRHYVYVPYVRMTETLIRILKTKRLQNSTLKQGVKCHHE